MTKTMILRDMMIKNLFCGMAIGMAMCCALVGILILVGSR